jgi:TolA-binding protein
MKDLDTILTSSLTSEREPPQEGGDSFDAIFNRAEPYQDPVRAYLRKEEMRPEGLYESIEERLMERLDHVAVDGRDMAAQKDTRVTDESIEAIIASETVVPQGRWDALEDRLMESIAAAPSSAPVTAATTRARYSWPIVSLLSTMAGHRAVQVIMVAGVAALALFALIIPFRGRLGLVTTITQAWGTSYRSDLGASVKNGTTIASAPGGSLSLSNKAGTVSLSDDASLTIERADSRSAEYRVFTAADRRSGRIAFSVEKRAKNQRFVVVTPWYEIHVVGTRFLLEQEQGGALATTITEGRVRIVSPCWNDLYVDAGQTFSMDAAHKAWRVEAVHTLAESQQATLESGVVEVGGSRLAILSTPSNARVFINTIYKGVTPFAVLRSAGACAVSVQLDGYTTRDTAVTIGNVRDALELTFDLRERSVAAPVDSSAKEGAAASAYKSAEIAASPKTPAAGTADSLALIAREHAAMVTRVRRLLDSAQQNEAGEWKRALGMYQSMAADTAMPPQYRQTALFSQGRLEADKLRDTAAAIKDFGTYCIVYPDGLFTGEALLRLAELEIKRNPASAIDYFQRFLLVDPRHPRRADVAYHLGLLLQQQNNFAEAIRMYGIALDQLGSKASKRRTEIEQMIATAEAARSLSKGGK